MRNLIELIDSSVKRLREGEEQFEATENPAWFIFIKRESSLLLRLTISLWLKIRFRKGIDKTKKRL